MATAPVAYESSAEARKARKAVKPLRWHRMASGLKATGVKGSYHLTQRSPDRRRGIFPWTVKQKGVEIKPGGFDTAAEGKEFASLYDAGLCGQPPVVVQVAPGTPEGVYRGTVAGESREPSDKYEKEVTREVAKMIGHGATPDEYDIVGNSPEYVAQMEQGGVDPSIVAAVLIATKAHGHAHDCPDKHVDLAEAAEDTYPREHLETITFRGQRFQIYFGGHTGTWHYMLPGGAKKGGFVSRDAAMIGAQRALGMLSTASVAVEEAKKKTSPHNIDAWMGINNNYFNLYNSEDLDTGVRSPVLSVDDEFVHRFPPGTSIETMKKWARRWDEENTFGGAEEAKKRLPQPDPGSGFWVTRSSLTRNYFLMKGDRLIGQYDNRDDALKAATTSEAEEARRPKGPRRR